MNNDPSRPSRQRHRIELELEHDVIAHLARWSASSGRCIEDIACQLLNASVRVLGDRPTWQPDPPGAPPASEP